MPCPAPHLDLAPLRLVDDGRLPAPSRAVAPAPRIDGGPLAPVPDPAPAPAPAPPAGDSLLPPPPPRAGLVPASLVAVRHGLFATGCYRQTFFPRATWEALPAAARPAGAIWIPLLDAFSVMELEFDWSGLPAA